MSFLTQQIAPPKSWEMFEDLCLALFQAVWQDPMAQKHGRMGQVQSGVDIFGSNKAGDRGLYGVACIKRDRLTRRDVDEHLARADQFQPPLTQYVLATTAPADVALQEYARQLSASRHAQEKFPITVFDWSAIQSLLFKHPDVARRFYPEHFAKLDGTRAGEYLERVRTLSEKTLELMQRTQGEAHPETQEAMENLLQILREQGHYAEAQVLQEKIISIRENLFRDDIAAGAFDEKVPHTLVFWRDTDASADQNEFITLHCTRLRQLSLENYRNFASLTIDFAPRLTVLVAQNGAGKSSILDALTCALHLFVKNFSTGRPAYIHDADVRRVTTNAQLLETESVFPVSINVDIEIDTRPIGLSANRTQKGDVGSVGDSIGLAMRTTLAKGEPVVLPLIAYYGTNRLRERATASEAANADDFEAEFFSRTAGYKDCLDPSSSYKYFEKWFGYAAKADFDVRNQQREQMGSNYIATDTAYTPLIKAVADAVDAVLAFSGWKNLRFSFTHHNLVMTHPESGVLEINQLSDGVRSMIALVADIAHRAVRLNAFLGRDAVIKTPGLVLIDEVDLHLHPAWQQVVLQSLLTAFPGIQFVVTTHSPQLISSVPDQCIRILENGQVYAAPKGTQGAESSRVLKRVFGTELRPPDNENTKLLNAYLDAVFADKWADPDVLTMREKLDQIFANEEPELTRADLYIENRQWELEDEENL